MSSPAQFITFRKDKGDEMEAFYKGENVILLYPYDLHLENILDSIDTTVTNWIRRYVEERLAKWEFSHPRENIIGFTTRL